MTPSRAVPAALALAAGLALAPLSAAAATPAAADPAAPAPASVPAPASAPAAGTDRLLVKFRAGTAPGTAEDVLASRAPELAAAGPGTAPTVDGAAVLTAPGELDEDRLAALTTALQQDPAVEYAAPDVRASTAFVPNDPSYAGLQWSLWDDPAGVGMPLAWDRATGAGQTIAIVDTGITAHPDLDANVLPGYDFVSLPENGRDGDGWDADPTDMGDYPDAALCPGSPMAPASSWHGTHTAGIAAADGNNGIGVTGVAPDARILPVRAVGACSQGYISDVAAGIAWAAGAPVPGAPANANPADVVSVSLAVPGAQCPAVLQSAITEATSRGVTVVVAAGNQGIDAAGSVPANCAGAVSVAATDVSGAMPAYSNFGAVTLAAPGGDPWAQVHSTGNAGAQQQGAPTYIGRNGTSMAAPVVAGTVALMREAAPGLSPQAVRELLTSTARTAPGGCALGCGAGIVDPVSAVIAAQGGQPFTVAGGIGGLHQRIAATAGAPVSRELCALGGTPCFQEFEAGWIVWNAGAGARWLPGLLPAQWWAIGAPA